MPQRTLGWYKQKFRGASFSESKAWPVSELLFKAQALPVERIPLAELIHNLRTMETDEVIGSPEFVRRAMKADCRYPILCLQKRGRRLIVMDGLHRLWKSHHLNREFISARVLNYKDLG